MPHDTTRHNVDVAIIGGGIAGLWVLNRLCNRGYNAVLFEHRALGSDQTIASQGMIHGGIKYTLSGALTGASEAIADMPDHWRACLRGEGDVDLRAARVLSDHFYMWSTASLASRLGGFFASRALRGRVDPVANDQLPPLFRQRGFKGRLYRLVDMVMDAPSVVAALASNMPGRIFTIDWQRSRLDRDSEGRLSIRLDTDNGSHIVNPRALVLTAGKGNETLLQQCGATAPLTQRRPLQQVMVQFEGAPAFYGHCLGADTTPRLTISTHPLADGRNIWYLGGSLAEKGAGQPAETVIDAARRELHDLMPWLDLDNARWATLPVDRAEPRQRNFARPDNAFAARAEGTANVVAAWPTKLTLSPHLADEVERRLGELAISPTGNAPPALPLAPPPVALTPWQQAFGAE